jgi:murein DD-endopeptidase MepM/ murein hydrolase activator NlpD
MTQIFLKTLILVGLISLNLPFQIFAQSLGKPARKSAIAPKVISEPANNLSLQINNQTLIPQKKPETNLQDQANSNLIPTLTPPTISAKPEKIDVFLENRSSGCRAIANKNIINLQPNLCPKPIPAIARAIPNSFPNSIPNNGDKKMFYPLPSPTAISSGFGWRVHPITGRSSFHQGVDLGAAEGTPVFAAYSGNVEVADWLGGLGKAVVISHGYSSETRYGHLSQILVQQGQYVKQGTVIGLVGSTGMSTGAHLHFELWQRTSGDWTVIDATNQILVAMDNLNRYLQSLAGR